jgi:hypothetical protein
MTATTCIHCNEYRPHSRPPIPISTPRSRSQSHCHHGCPLRSSPPLRDYGMIRQYALCDRQDPMLTSPCSLPYANPRFTRNILERCCQQAKIYIHSSLAFPALVFPRSGTCRTAARGPGTQWTSGTDRVRDLPAAPEIRNNIMEDSVAKIAEEKEEDSQRADIYLQ